MLGTERVYCLHLNLIDSTLIEYFSQTLSVIQAYSTSEFVWHLLKMQDNPYFGFLVFLYCAYYVVMKSWKCAQDHFSNTHDTHFSFLYLYTRFG